MSTKLAYLAGIIDGEGTITLAKQSNGYGARRVEVSVANTDKGLMDWLQAEFGGSVRQRRGRADHYKKLYDWRVRDRRARELLRECVPYLKVKKPRADLILKGWGNRSPEFERAVLAL